MLPPRLTLSLRWCLLLAVFGAAGCSGGRSSARDSLGASDPNEVDADPAGDVSALWYAGHDARGVPHYATRSFTDRERALLRTMYGVEDPTRLYISDSTDDGLLKYDTQRKRCATCYVNSYRIGFASVRRPGESWEEVERRVRAMHKRDFSAGAHVGSTSTAALDPAIRPAAEQMLADARRAGYRLRIVATYRSPEREAYLMAMGGGRTHTLTSLHSYGRALDIVVGDGNLRHRATRAAWVSFRRWVSAYRGGMFHILGTPSRTWDWPHVELPSPDIGFRSIDAAVERARHCDTSDSAGGSGAVGVSARPACDFVPHPGSVAP